MTDNRARSQQEPTNRSVPHVSSLSDQSLDGIRNGALESLRQGRELLSSINNEVYTAVCPFAFNATIGQHYRHCLDHLDTLFAQISNGAVNYDLRLRNPNLEVDIESAMRLTEKFESIIRDLDNGHLSKKIYLNAGVDEEELALCETTIARELYYVTAHAIHHYALIGVIGCHFNLNLPENFGVAPSTVAYLATKTKA